MIYENSKYIFGMHFRTGGETRCDWRHGRGAKRSWAKVGDQALAQSRGGATERGKGGALSKAKGGGQERSRTPAALGLHGKSSEPTQKRVELVRALGALRRSCHPTGAAHRSPSLLRRAEHPSPSWRQSVRLQAESMSAFVEPSVLTPNPPAHHRPPHRPSR